MTSRRSGKRSATRSTAQTLGASDATDSKGRLTTDGEASSRSEICNTDSNVPPGAVVVIDISPNVWEEFYRHAAADLKMLHRTAKRIQKLGPTEMLLDELGEVIERTQKTVSDFEDYLEEL